MSAAVNAYLGRIFNRTDAARGIDRAEWDRVVIDNRPACLGCFGSELVPVTSSLGEFAGADATRLECWLDMPLDDCGRCACRIYCGSRVEFPDSRPGEVFEAVGRIDTTRNRCQRWSLKTECRRCD